MEAGLSSFDPVIPFRSSAGSVSKSSSSSLKHDQIVCFHRTELSLILWHYGLRVAKGEWRDYAIDMGRDYAVFSIFRHTSERPLYQLEKRPLLAKKQGAYLVRNDKGMVLKRGHELALVLKVFDKRIELVNS